MSNLDKLPIYCYAVHPENGSAIKITRGVPGYNVVRMPGSEVEKANEKEGVTRRQVNAMVIGSMFGWDVPGVDPDSEFNDFNPYKRGGVL